MLHPKGETMSKIDVHASRAHVGVLEDQKHAPVQVHASVTAEAVYHQMHEMYEDGPYLRKMDMTRILAALEKELPDVVHKAVYAAVHKHIEDRVRYKRA